MRPKPSRWLRPLTALATLVIVAALALRGSELLRLWAPLIGIVGGCVVAALFGIYSFDRVLERTLDRPPAGRAGPWPRLRPLLLDPAARASCSWVSSSPSRPNGAAIAAQRVSWRDDRAVNFRQVQGALAGTGVSNLMAGLSGAVPNIINPGFAAFTQITGVASRRVGYIIGGILDRPRDPAQGLRAAQHHPRVP